MVMAIEKTNSVVDQIATAAKHRRRRLRRRGRHYFMWEWEP